MSFFSVVVVGAAFGVGITLWQTKQMLHATGVVQTLRDLSWEETKAIQAYRSPTLGTASKVYALEHFTSFLSERFDDSESELRPVVDGMAGLAFGRMGKVLDDAGRSEEAATAYDTAARHLRAIGRHAETAQDVRSYIEAVDELKGRADSGSGVAADGGGISVGSVTPPSAAPTEP